MTSIFKKERTMAKKAATPIPLPYEMLVESYERRANVAEFEKIDLVIDFRPGKDGIGAVIKVLNKALFFISSQSSDLGFY
jgi:hypothetical protein